MSRYAFAAAGTGGHVYPALAVAERLVADGAARDDVVFFGGGRLEKRVVPAAGFAFVEVPLQGLQRSLSLRNLRIPLTLWQATRTIRAELRRRRSRVLLATGGYVAVPAGWSAHREGVTLFLQEQNAEPGLANKVAARWARAVFLGFPGSGLAGEVTGNPLRAELAGFDRDALRPAARERYGLPGDGPVLGVLGGSLGAGVVNRAAVEYAARFAEGTAIVHIAGPDHADAVHRQAVGAPVPWRVVPFEEEMQHFYAASDLVLCRSGAVTVSELAATATPAVLVPRAAGSARHQDANAAYLEEIGGAVVVAEFEAGTIPALLAELLGDGLRLARMAGAAGLAGRPDATAHIAGALMEAAGG